MNLTYILLLLNLLNKYLSKETTISDKASHIPIL